jgi:hypothetical protein
MAWNTDPAGNNQELRTRGLIVDSIHTGNTGRLYISSMTSHFHILDRLTQSGKFP